MIKIVHENKNKESDEMWTSRAPSNIALIKYMGKGPCNIPANVSLSCVLDQFYTEVSLELIGVADEFVNTMELSADAVTRFLEHLRRIKDITNCRESFRVRSRNNFPHSVGIASSASSFAALTICAFRAISAINGAEMPSPEQMSEVSRLASGSSCRSFFAPWCIWDKSGARKIHLEIGRLLHDVIIINVDAKEVSSSEAHRRVTSSLLFEGREKRAAIRCEKLIESLNNGRWDSAQQICWEEFWDMHALFATADPHFEYIHTETMRILSIMQNCWKEHGDGPLVTIDAGPNVHLLWRNDQNLLRNETKQKIICCALAAKDV